MSNTKKLLAALIAALLVLTLVPVSALAASCTVNIVFAVHDPNLTTGYTYGDSARYATSNGIVRTSETVSSSTTMNWTWTIKSYSQLGFQPASGWKFKGVNKYSMDKNLDVPASVWRPGKTTNITFSGETLYYVFERTTTSYTITYNQNCNDTVSNMPSPNPQSGSTTASSITLSGNRPTRSGYEFQGWSTSSGSTTAQYQPGGSYSLSNGTSRTLYAVWKQAQKYQLTVETLVDNVKVGEGTGSDAYAVGTTVQIAPDKTKFNTDEYTYTFQGWSIKIGNGTFTNAGSESTSFKTGNAATAIRANYHAERKPVTPATVSLTVNTYVNEEIEKTDTKDYTDRAVFNLSANKTAFDTENFDYQFIIWTQTKGSGHFQQNGEKMESPRYQIVGDTVLNAYYTATPKAATTFTVAFDSNGGSDVASITGICLLYTSDAADD